jgi:hypothetical protein
MLTLRFLPSSISKEGAGMAQVTQAEQPRGESLSLSTAKNFLFPMSSRLALGSTQPPSQWVSGALPPEW